MAAETPVKVWLDAARPRTLPAAVAPVMVGSALAWRAGMFNAAAAALCLGFALLVQIGANYANDYYDHLHGADTAERIGPRRAVAAGLVAPAAMRRAMWLTFTLALVVGLLLVPWGGWWLVLIGVACIGSAIAYTGGPWPLGYHGLGDLFVFVFFGLIAVCLTFFVQTGRVSLEAVLAGAAIGLLTVDILLVNNYRDMETDRKAGKRTLVVRFGRRFALGQLAAAHLGACAVIVGLAFRGCYDRKLAFVVAGILAYYGFLQWRALRQARAPREMIFLLGWCGAYVIIYATTLSVLIVTG